MTERTRLNDAPRQAVSLVGASHPQHHSSASTRYKEKAVRNERICISKIAAVLIVLTASVLALPGSGRAQATSYLDFDQLTRELRSLVNDSDMARMSSAGTSIEGREIWVVEIGNPSGKPLEERPAVLVVGNLEGDHVLGSALALETIRYFLDGAQDNAEIQTVLDEQTIYVFPRVNPDGAESMFASVKWERSRNARPYDDDNDGRIDEDGPEDLNGDGLITVMRALDPSGDYMIDTADARLMKKADPTQGEQGEYTLYWEGTDSDGDGFLNEDGPGGVDLNRNFQHAYPYWQRDAGPHMISEPESRALMDFVIAHRNIGAILAFGRTDNLVTPPDSRGNVAGASTLDLPTFADASNSEIFEIGVFGAQQPSGFGFFFFRGGRGSGFRGAQPGRDNDPNSGRRPATTFNQADLEYFKAASEAYKSITGIESVGVHRTPEGAFFQYGYFQYGVPSFSTPGWGLPSAASEEESEESPGEGEARPEAAAPRPAGARPAAGGARPGGFARAMAQGGRPGAGAAEAGADARVLSAFDAAGIDAFVEWTAYTHPTLGEVEIGGFRPFAATNPPAEELAELGRAHGEFVAHLAGMLPRVTIVEAEVTAHGGGIYTVAVEVENSGYFPTSLQHGVVSRSVGPITVQIQVPPEDVITGDAKTSMIRQLDGSHNRERFEWVIRGRDGARVEITALAQKGGTDSATVTLR
jgi:murein tripeptide amidase MpaA